MRKLLSPRNLLIIIIVLALMLGSAILLRVPLPAIVLAAEKIFSIGGFSVTNTLIATLLADIIIIVLALLATRKMQDIPHGLQNLVEWVLEIFYNLNEDIAGKSYVKKLFPIFMSYLLFLMVANWSGLIPGFDSVGIIEPVEVAYQNAGISTGYKKGSFLGISTLTGDAVTLTPEQIAEIEEGAALKEDAHGAEEEHHASKYGAYVILPLLRPAATDLNLPLALALISVVWTQIIGIQALGLGYFRKYLVPPMTGMKPIDAFVGILEFISEIAKIISFTFRLFGNMFAGMVLLFVMTFLIPFLVPLPFYALELFVGFMQAFVFGILTLIFMAMSVVSHDHH